MDELYHFRASVGFVCLSRNSKGTEFYTEFYAAFERQVAHCLLQFFALSNLQTMVSLDWRQNAVEF